MGTAPASRRCSARSTACGAAGHTRAEIGWVGPVVPYARVGATVGRTFLVHRKELT